MTIHDDRGNRHISQSIVFFSFSPKPQGRYDDLGFSRTGSHALPPKLII